MKREYITECLYRAAAIVLTTGQQPDHIIRVRGDKSRAVLTFHVETDVIEKLESNELLVDPVAFKDVFIPLKRKVFRVIDED